MSTTPSAEAQLAFLSKLQRLFAEGDFTATYKFALLIALAELAVERGFDDGNPLTLKNDWIAERFVEMYWSHATPYAAKGATPMVLVQNIGTQASVITAIIAFRQAHPRVTLRRASAAAGYRRLLRKVSVTVAAQPIKYLQNLGGATDAFVYQRVQGGVMLLPGVAFCLRRFQPLIQQQARTGWVRHVAANRRNAPALGDSVGLESFLFHTSRQSLALITDGLQQLGNGRCFYCQRAVAKADIDHFIPFALYPRDSAHNFVVAHPACNNSKSDTLAAHEHLSRWVTHVRDNARDLDAIGDTAGLVGDATAVQSVARWAYESAASVGARAWVRRDLYEFVDGAYLGVF